MRVWNPGTVLRWLLAAGMVWVWLALSAHGMDHGMGEFDHMRWDEKNDAAFLSGMIVHHEGAVEMTEAVLKKTQSEAVRRWGRAILSTQRREIREMESQLDILGIRDEAAAAEMEAEMAMMMEQTHSPDPDVNYLEMMIPHHAGAIDMAVPALVMSENPVVRRLAQDIIVAQAREIAEFRAWLDQHGG